MSLLEVLAAIGVLSIGLLGLAALLPVGRYTLAEATKADRGGQCGRAALRDVVVRRMLDYHNWYDPTQGKFVNDPSYNGGSNYSKSWYDGSGNPTAYLPASFLIDPEGVANSMTDLGTIPRLATAAPPCRGSRSACNGRGILNTHLPGRFDLPGRRRPECSPARGHDSGRRPIGRPLNLNASGNANPLDDGGQYTWFLTVTPQPNNPTRFTVSVVVCFNRNLHGDRGNGPWR